MEHGASAEEIDYDRAQKQKRMVASVDEATGEIMTELVSTDVPLRGFDTEAMTTYAYWITADQDEARDPGQWAAHEESLLFDAS